MTALVWLTRLLVGGVFTVAGWAKCVDPTGLAIKMGEYTALWNIDIPSSLLIVGASLMAGFELILGVMMLCGCYRRATVILMLLFTAFFTPLTLYIWLKNPVSDCGCFGDLFILSNRDTFLKNVILTLALVSLAFFNRRVKGIFVPYTQWIAGGIVTLYALVVIGIGLYSQPLIDFRRFEPGTLITVGASDDDSAEPIYRFTYTRDGVEKEFDVDNLPDSTWTFVDRHLVGGNETATDGFLAYDGDDEVSAETFADGQVLLVTIPNPELMLAAASIIDDLAERADGCGIETYLILGGGEETVSNYVTDMMPAYSVLSAEPTLLKEFARGNIAITLIDNGVIKWKRTMLSLSRSFLQESDSCDFNELAPPGPAFMWMLTLIFAAVMVTACLLDRGALAIYLLARRHKKKKA